MVNIVQVLLGNVFIDFWYSILEWFAEFIPSYGLVIILFTVALKTVLIPMDYLQKKSAKEQSEKQARIKPEVDKLKKKYKNNTEKLNQKTMELYKKENLSGNCLGMLVSFAATILIFITLFFALQGISEDKIETQFLELQTAYTQAEQEGTDQEEAVLNKYNEIKEGFLWVENIWRPDTRVSPIPDYETFLDETNVQSEEVSETQYDEVVNILRSNNSSNWNGLYILTILAAAFSYLTQKVMKKHTKKPVKENSDQPDINTGFLSVLLPALMIYITTQFNAAFSLYIVVNSIMTVIISLLVYRIMDKNKEKEQEETEKKPDNKTL